MKAEDKRGIHIHQALWILLLSLAFQVSAEIDIRLAGNTFFKNREIRAALPEDPEEITKEALVTWREDAAFYLDELYNESGFFDVQALVRMEFPEGDSGTPVADIRISEGARYQFDTVRVLIVDTSAQDTLPSVPLQSEVPLRSAPQLVEPSELNSLQGEPFEREKIFEDKRLLLREYGNAGFVRARVEETIEIRGASKTVAVDFMVEPSYPVVFDTLIIRNARAAPADSLYGITRDKILRSLIPYIRGDTVRIAGNDKLIEKLQYTGAFNFVRLKDSLLPESGNRSALILYAEERIPGKISSSVFFETQFGPGVSVDVSHNNIAGTLNEVGLGGSLAKDKQTLHAGYGSPITLGYLLRLDNELIVNWYQNDPIPQEVGFFEGDFNAVNSTRLSRPITYWSRFVGTAELELKSKFIDSLTRERAFNLNFINTLFLAWLNQPMDPTRGMRYSLTFGNGGPLIKQDRFQLTEFRHNWVDLQSSFYYYYPPLRQVKLATRLDGGRFFGEGGANSDRFFLGGARSVRSYGYQELCPEKTVGGTCPGEDIEPAYIMASLEMRVDAFDFGYISATGLWKHLIPLQLVPFADYGRVWDINKGFSTPSFPPGSDLRYAGEGLAFGLGFRYPLLGIFNFRLDLAYGRKNSEGGSLSKYWPDRWVVDLAQAF